MKPRIRLDHKVWCCYLPDWQRTRIVGMGYSPLDAFNDWKEQREAALPADHLETQMNEPTEAQIAAVSTAPRVTPADIEANIRTTCYFTAADAFKAPHLMALAGDVPDPALHLLTFCVLVLRNGFTVTGQSACASPENFNAEIGQRIAREDAIRQVWPLMGCQLKEQLYQRTVPPVPPVLRPGANIHGIGPDTDGGPNPNFRG